MDSEQPNPVSVAAADLFHVKGLVAVVTGGGSGIGFMITKALAHNGAKVYILGRRLPVLEDAASKISPPNSGFGSVIPVVCDVTSQDDLAAAASRVAADAGHVDLLVCNSGIGGPYGVRPKPGMSLDEFVDANLAVPMEQYTQTFAVNASAVWYTTMSFLRLLDEGNKRHRDSSAAKSQVVAVSSIGGFNKQNTGGYAYGQSKAACTHLVKQLAVALPQWDVRANVICPGLYPSDMSAPIIARTGGQFPKDQVPLERAGTEQDMAGAILYLASRAGAYCNGTVVTTDGGRLGVFPSTF